MPAITRAPENPDRCHYCLQDYNGFTDPAGYIELPSSKAGGGVWRFGICAKCLDGKANPIRCGRGTYVTITGEPIADGSLVDPPPVHCDSRGQAELF
jgi:hypothetical protein